MKLTKISAVIITTLGLSSAAFASEIPHPPIANPDSIINQLPEPTQPGPSDVPPIEGPNGPIIQKPGYSSQEGYEAAHILGKQVDKNTGDIDVLGKQVGKNTDDIDVLGKQVGKNTDDIDVLGKQVGKNTDDIDVLGKQVDKNTGDIDVLGKQVDKNTGDIDVLGKQVDKNTGDIDVLGKQVGKNTDDIAKNKAETDTRIETAISKGQTALDSTNERLDSSLEEQKKVNYLVGNALASNESYWQQQWATNDNYAASINKNTSDIAKNRQDINKLNSRVDRLDQKVDDLNDTMKRGFASQAALNGLFQPYGVGKLNATMALGGYESKTAIAAGTGYRFDENTAVKAGIATNTDDFKGVTYNVGVNFEW
ncbi:YadA-like family protein [Providencia stuartii]|uniref:YadA-like family protein n=4 Tax=Providencia TaxID=586 RepID=UPI0024AC4BFF|nr:YadA-like family protein [Providencia stuartii]MCR4081967.1 YadA-like family protein [Providencia stuartii]